MAFVKLVLKLLTNHTSCLKWCFIWSNQKLRPSTVVMQQCDWLTVETHLTPGGLSSLNETQWDVMRGLRSVFSFSLKVTVWFEAVSAASWIFNEMAFLIFRPWFLYSSHHKDLRYCWTITNEHTWSQSSSVLPKALFRHNHIPCIVKIAL